MRKVILPLTLCFIASLGIINAQSISASSTLESNQSQQNGVLPAAFYETSTSPIGESPNGVENSSISIDFQNTKIPNFGSYGPAARPDGTEEFGENLIYTSGPFINDAPDLSILENVTNGMDLYGFGVNYNNSQSLAESFVLHDGFDISKIDVYAYQTGTLPPSITAMYVQIWNGDPSGGGSVVWGDLSTNVLETVVDSGVYRVLEDDQSNTDRKIQKVTASINGLTLSPGTYWVEYSLEGSGSSGPWAPPISVLGETITGDALQKTSSGWQAVIDAGVNEPQGLPVQIYGTINLQGSCAELNPPYDWLFEEALNITTGGSFTVANDLTLQPNESFSLEHITAYMFSEWPISEVDVTYYEDDNGMPGSVIGSENAVTLNHVNAVGSSHVSIHNVYKVDMTVDAFDFPGDVNSSKKYWIGLSAKSSNNTNVFWGITSGNSVGNPAAQNNNGVWGIWNNDYDGLYTWYGDCGPVLGVDDNELIKLSVYPNPANNMLNLESAQNIESVTLFNLLGQKLLSKDVNNTSAELNISNLQVGTYILQTTIEGQVNTQKIIKQ